MSSTKSEFEVSILKEEHAKSTLQLFVKSFCDSEPITKELNISYKDYEPFAEAVIKKAIHDGISVVAVNQNNEVIACAIAEDMTNPFQPQLSQYPKMKPIFDILDDLSDKFLSDKKFIYGKLAHVWIAIVDQRHRGQSLSTAIDMACAELLLLKGYDFVYAEFTNALSEKIAHHYDVFSVCNTVDYQDWSMKDGTKPFEKVHGKAVSYIIGIRPGVQLDALKHCYHLTAESVKN